jgi:hypothetical protein
MARIPLVVCVECDSPGCNEGVIFHAKAKEITTQALEARLAEEGWLVTTDAEGSPAEFCPECAKKRGE